MKYKTTKKAVMEGHYKVIKTSYCAVQYLTMFESPDAYTCGGYGWNADIYEIGGGVALVTGYRPFGNACPAWDKVEGFEQKARRIYCHKTWKYETKRRKIRELLEQFAEEA